MSLKTIKSEEDYDAAFVEIERLFASKPGSDDFDRLEVLAVLVQDYERVHHPVEPPDLDAMLDYKLDKRGFPRNKITTDDGARFGGNGALNGSEANISEVEAMVSLASGF